MNIALQQLTLPLLKKRACELLTSTATDTGSVARLEGDCKAHIPDDLSPMHESNGALPALQSLPPNRCRRTEGHSETYDASVGSGIIGKESNPLHHDCTCSD